MRVSIAYGEYCHHILERSCGRVVSFCNMEGLLYPRQAGNGVATRGHLVPGTDSDTTAMPHSIPIPGPQHYRGTARPSGYKEDFQAVVDIG